MAKYKTIILIIVAILAVAGLIYFVFIPQISSSFMLWAKNTIKQEDIVNLQKKKADLNNLKKDEKQAEDLSNALASMLPDKKDAGAFMIEVEALANSSNVSLTDIKFSEEKKTAAASSSSSTDETAKKSSVKGASTAKFKEMTFELTAKGNYQDIINFIKGLEKINRAITIEKCDLSESQNIIQASIKGRAYYQNG